VVVYKLDRISRSILDFAKMMELFTKYNVEFISSTEKFDTSTPMGRAMLNICIVFAQLERETIIKRVTDAYHSRTRKGIRMGGSTPYGYALEPFTIQGISTKRLTANPDTADNLRLMYEMYSQPNTSLTEVAHYFVDNNILIHNKPLFKSTLTQMLRNPVYVQADMDVYEFFKTQGAEIEGDAADFTGVTGCWLFRNKDSQITARDNFQGKTLVPSPHEGLVSSDLWLKCRKKLMANPSYQPARKAVKTWLAGKAKCGRCGYALMSVQNRHLRYMRCRNRAESRSCDGCGTIRTHEMEQLVYDSIVEKLKEFKNLSAGRDGAPSNPKLTTTRVELAQVDAEIDKLVESLAGANPTLIQFANRKADELSARRQSLMMELAELTADDIPTARLAAISDYLDDWENTDLDDKRQVVNSVITVIRATSENMEIEWKI